MAITTESSAALVPMMSALFLAIAPFPIITHFSQILLALSAVLKDAFHFQVFFIVFTGFSSSSDILMGREAVVPIIASYRQQKPHLRTESLKDSGKNPIFHESSIGIHHTDV